MKNVIKPIIFDKSLKEKSAELIIECEPIGKARPRVTVRGPFAHAYTPKKTKSYENMIKNEYLNKYGYSNILEGPLEAQIAAYFPIPKSSSKSLKKKMILNQYKHTNKPDIDNVQKAILDALNGVAYSDDSQIIKITGQKFYSSTPRIELKLKEIKHDDSYKINVLEDT